MELIIEAFKFTFTFLWTMIKVIFESIIAIIKENPTPSTIIAIILIGLFIIIKKSYKK